MSIQCDNDKRTQRSVEFQHCSGVEGSDEEMKQECYFAPRSERWVIQSLAGWVAQRIMGVSALSDSERRVLMRMLFGLQHFPRIDYGLSVRISWEDGETFGAVSLTREHLSIERGHTRLQYFPGEHHLISFYDILKGTDRQLFLENWLPFVSNITDPETTLSIADYSSAALFAPPLNEQWMDPLGVIYFDFDTVPERKYKAID